MITRNTSSHRLIEMHCDWIWIQSKKNTVIENHHISITWAVKSNILNQPMCPSVFSNYGYENVHLLPLSWEYRQLLLSMQPLVHRRNRMKDEQLHPVASRQLFQLQLYLQTNQVVCLYSKQKEFMSIVDISELSGNNPLDARLVRIFHSVKQPLRVPHMTLCPNDFAP